MIHKNYNYIDDWYYNIKNSNKKLVTQDMVIKNVKENNSRGVNIKNY